MDTNNEKRDNRKRKARERQAKRRERRAAMASSVNDGLSKLSHLKPEGIPKPVQRGFSVALNVAQDIFWHLRHRTSFWKIIVGIVGAIVLLFFLSLFFSANIGPNISTMGLGLGGMSVEAATAQLENTFNNEMRVNIRLHGRQVGSVTASELGIHLDAQATAQVAKDAGLSGLPFGHQVEPVLEVDYGTAQNYMLSLVNEVFIPPYEAGYEWREGDVVAVPGRASRELDVVLTVQRIVDDAINIMVQGQLDLLTTTTQPRMIDSTPYLEEARAFVNSDLTIIGYDPFTDEEQQWQTTREEMARWLVAGVNGLTVREDGLERFVEGVNTLLNDGDNPRYLNEELARAALVQAIDAGETTVQVRINYLPSVHTIVRGETGFSIGRSTGLPFRLISDANPSVDWNQLIVGQEINLPSRDTVVPLDPISDKRIVVDLDRFYLVAYENGEIVFDWAISIGMRDAPTSPGIYQILEKVDVAYGSSFNLCSDSGCGQWQMDYFMGIYEVAPGLTNGFHGAVLLPNGGYLDGGSSQVRSTFGCVMSDNEVAVQLFEWADVGTMVEILSDEFAPESELARQAVEFMDAQNQF
ncbi:MAG: L,D-transpeptidase family protein [Anaerolineae bacterium]|nr:L,D-transpeptidase family protein [Anaerolineae bacterium]